jgi:predicted GIY-YIG superfamily endonuclease
MLDYQRIVDDIRSAVFANGAGSLAALRGVAADFSVACDEVNERLRQCGAMLRQGLRGEALQLCETEPNLLDAVALLDFTELEPWQQLLAQHGLEAPAPLNLDVASQLNEAYATQQPLETMLQQHRRHALAHSPLSVRIAIMRRLASLDVNNPVWREDLQRFEEERLKQIEREIGEASSQADAARLAILEEELREDREASPLAESLATSAAAARQAIVMRVARMNLERISAQLVLAFNRKDETAARSFFSEWQGYVGQCPLSPGDPLYDRTSGVLAWLAECEAQAARVRAYAEAVQTLERSLQGASLAALTSAYAKVTQHGYPIPHTVAYGYRTRTKELRRIARQRRGRYVAAAAALLLVVGALGAWGITQQMFRRQVDHQAAALAALIESDTLEAEAYLERLRRESPAVAREEQIQTLQGQLQERIRASADRKKALDSLLSSIAGILGDDPERALLSEAAAEIDRAGKLAVTSQEKEKVETCRAALADARAKAQQSIDARFLGKLAGLEKATENLSPDDLDTLFARTAKLRQDLRKLESSAAGVSDAARQRLKPLYARVDAAEHDAREEGHQQAALRLLTLAAGSPQLFKARLAAYATEFPQSARSPSFLQAEQEASLWEGLEKWNQLGQEWQSKDFTQLDPAMAKDLAERASSVLRDYGNYPEAEGFRKRIPFLRAIAQRAEGDPPASRRIRELFSAPVMQLEVIRDTDGHCYYFRAAPPSLEHMTTLKYVTDFTMSLGV